MKRAIRRHHKARMKAKATAMLRSWGSDWLQTRNIGHWADNLAKCSCSMCGNPRRHGGGLTVQERRLAEEVYP